LIQVQDIPIQVRLQICRDDRRLDQLNVNQRLVHHLLILTTYGHHGKKEHHHVKKKKKKKERKITSNNQTIGETTLSFLFWDWGTMLESVTFLLTRVLACSSVCGRTLVAIQKK
jgi:hypothetical protein